MFGSRVNARELMQKIEAMPIAQLGSTLDLVHQVNFEALDNAAHTDGVKVWEDGISRHTDEFCAAWLGSVETILACCDFVTEEVRQWYEAEGVRF